MSRKVCAVMLAFALLFALLVDAAVAAPLEADVPLELTAASAMLLEAETGTVIFEKNADEKRPVASVTKLMTLLICLEELEAGRLKWEDQITVSQNAAGQIGSQALLDAGAAYPLRDLLRCTIIASANDAAVALAEHMAGTEMDFAALMNQRAQELGMTGTCYVNATGLPVEGQHTTARDVAVLALEGFSAAGYAQVTQLAEKLLQAANDKPLYVCLQQDMAKALGQCLSMRLPPGRPCICLDKLIFGEDSYLDIGQPVGPCYPVVIKTLVLSGP